MPYFIVKRFWSGHFERQDKVLIKAPSKERATELGLHEESAEADDESEEMLEEGDYQESYAEIDKVDVTECDEAEAQRLYSEKEES